MTTNTNFHNESTEVIAAKECDNIDFNELSQLFKQSDRIGDKYLSDEEISNRQHEEEELKQFLEKLELDSTNSK